LKSRDADARLRQAAFLKGGPVTRRILMVIGGAILAVSGLGFILGLVWLWLSEVHGTPEYVLEARFQVMLCVLPALLLGVAFVGTSLIIHNLASRRRESKTQKSDDFHLSTRFRT
jgi:hypothetical protein